ncbi:MAG: C40 family peptidase [Myxococcales bacterium]|nr:C40 family peptidase [Myxococcales bacterium]
MSPAAIASSPPARKGPRFAPLFPCAGLALIAALCGACSGRQEAAATRSGGDAARGESQAACPVRREAAQLLPGTRAEHQRLDYWLARYDAAALDRPLLEPVQIEAYNAAVGRRPGQHPFAQRALWPAPPAPLLDREVSDRLRYMRERLDAGQLLRPDGSPLPAPEREVFDARRERVEASLRVALGVIPIRCGPYPAPLYKPDLVAAYDRNACSSIRPQEPLTVLDRWPSGMLLVQTRYALGFIAADAPLSPAVAPALRQPVAEGARRVAASDLELRAESGETLKLPAGASVPEDESGSVLVASARGLTRAKPPAALTPTRRALTRRALLTEAFRYLGTPYGFGGKDGGRDCSRLQLDLLSHFDLALPRHSGYQARAGSYSIDVSGKSDAEKRALIDRVGERGVLLLHFPGHIMLYLGKDEEGRHMALHALGEYADPCNDVAPEAPQQAMAETVVDVQRTVVSDLEIGRGSSRKAFLERLTTLVVFGAAPDPELKTQVRMAAAPPPELPDEDTVCSDSVTSRIFVSPRKPAVGAPLRVIATTSEEVGRAELWLFDPDGKRLSTMPRHLGGPPHSVWTEIEAPRAGRYTALWTQGTKVIGCKRIGVRPNRPEPQPPEGQAVWEPSWSWERDTENLWSAFVEQLFDYPPDDGRTWQNLHDLLRDRERNLLYDHRGLGEEAKLTLVPDCADLPYTLRAYFAWKLRLPFAYRQCSRGRTGVPPSCGPLRSNLMAREAADEVGAVERFINRHVRSGVHSASGRTSPDDEHSDLYPVALTRRSLPAGTVYADPYGHVMLLTKWFPQGAVDTYGVLMASEAQPDGTVGRRRFFRGSFLFEPSTEDVGSGFKYFRPIVRDPEQAQLVALKNEELKSGEHHPAFSRQQYEGSLEDFYERMDALINPEPLDPRARLRSLVDALEESIRRRVIAVDNGERFVAERGKSPIEMPIGHDIFETTGPWEDYSTPSRDLRLLISMDAVSGFPARVARHPERFQLGQGAEAAETAKALGDELGEMLSARSIEYRRSDGQPQRLTLAEVVERAPALELAYNPNDCIERRWGAPEGSPEAAGCVRSAPAEQRARMVRYRTWFHERRRPQRGARAP